MTIIKITYATKSNAVPISNRPQQATAEDFNEIKTVVNNAIDVIEPIPTVVAAATYTVLATDKKLHVTYTSIGPCVITIPSALITNTFDILIKNSTGLNTVTIESEGAETLDGETNQVMSGISAVGVYSDGTNLFMY